MWNPESRARHCRVGLRYPSDLSDAEWTVIAPQIPPGRRGGTAAQRRFARRAQRRALRPGNRLPVATSAGRTAAAQHVPQLSAAVGLGRNPGAHPSRALSARPRTAGSGSQPDRRRHRQPERRRSGKRGPASDPVGYDAGKKIKGVKYHILVDTLGLLLSVAVHHAGIQDRDGAALVLDKKTRALFPFIRVIFADGGYQGPVAATAVGKTGDWQLSIVKRSDQAKGFVVLAQVLADRAYARMADPLPAPRPPRRALPPDLRRLHPSRHDPTHAAQADPAIIFQDEL